MRALWSDLSRRQEAIDGFLGAAYALHHVAALLSMAERRDFGRAVGDGRGPGRRWWARMGGAKLKAAEGR